MPKRIEALEQKVAALEGKQRKPIPSGRECSSCGEAMKLVSEKDDDILGFAGVKLHALKCPACGHDTTRKWSPSKGYE